MALIRCPECRNKISEHATTCPHCGFSFDEKSLEQFKQKLEQRRQINQEINQKSIKLHLIWLLIFALVIGIAGWWQN